MTKFIVQCTEVRFASFLSGGVITAIVVNPTERKLAKRTSVQCSNLNAQPEIQILRKPNTVCLLFLRSNCVVTCQAFSSSF